MTTTDSSPPVASVERLADHDGQRVTLRGWLYAKSSKGKLHFVQLRDGTGTVQCVVFKKNVTEELFEAREAHEDKMARLSSHARDLMERLERDDVEIEQRIARDG